MSTDYDPLERLPSIEWQQKISRALGCQLGEVTYPLDQCVDKILELRGMK